MYIRELPNSLAVWLEHGISLTQWAPATVDSTFTFYTYSTGCTDDEPRWRDDGISDVFFLDFDDARGAVVELHSEISDDALSDPMTIRLEKIRTVPITNEALLSLLNGDIASLIESYEVVESFSVSNGAPASPADAPRP